MRVQLADYVADRISVYGNARMTVILVKHNLAQQKKRISLGSDIEGMLRSVVMTFSNLYHEYPPPPRARPI